MSKIRVHALAKELGVSSKDLLESLQKLNIEVKNHMSTIDESEQELVKASFKKENTDKVEMTKADSKKETEPKEKLEKVEEVTDTKKVVVENNKKQKHSNSTHKKKSRAQKREEKREKNEVVEDNKETGDDVIITISTPITIKDFAKEIGRASCRQRV